MTEYKPTADKPVDEDRLGVDPYYDAIAEYIINCDTPSTISIQGNWGTGKTSAMKCVQKRLNKMRDEKKSGRIEIGWIDAWPYSCLNQDNNIAAAILQDFYTLVEKEVFKSESKNKTIKNRSFINAGILLNSAKVIASAGAAAMTFMGGTDLSAVGSMLGFLLDRKVDDKKKDGITEDESGQKMDSPLTESISQLKEFKELIEKTLEEENVDHMIIFIDDLDRLNPKTALELLEAMRNFMNCSRCVFVLAIDYDVVKQGARMKYGEQFDDEKGQSFFDKIIQLQFSLPVETYDISQYLVSHEFVEKGNVKELKEYEDAICALIGRNPRSINRVFNLLKLHEYIKDNKSEDIKYDRYNMMITLIIQLNNKELYSDLYNIARQSDESDLQEELCEYYDGKIAVYNEWKDKDIRQCSDKQRRDYNKGKYLDNINRFMKLDLENGYNGCDAETIKQFANDIKSTAKIASIDDIGVPYQRLNDKNSAQDLIYNYMDRLIKESLIKKEDIEELCDKEKAKMFKLHGVTPLLDSSYVIDEKDLLDNRGKVAYFEDPVTIEGHDYYLANQWYDSGKMENVTCFMDWVNDNYSKDYDKIGFPVCSINTYSATHGESGEMGGVTVKARAIRIQYNKELITILLKGSEIAKNEVSSCAPSVHKKREKAKEAGWIDDEYRTTRNILFKGKTAAPFIKGGPGEEKWDWKYTSAILHDMPEYSCIDEL